MTQKELFDAISAESKKRGGVTYKQAAVIAYNIAIEQVKKNWFVPGGDGGDNNPLDELKIKDDAAQK